MSKEQRTFGFLALLLVIIFIGAVYFIPQLGDGPEEGGFSIGLPEGTVKGEVIEIIDSGEISLGEISQPYVVMRVQLLEGAYRGFEVEIDYGRRQIRPPGPLPEVGDRIFVIAGTDPNNQVTAFFADFDRSRPLLILAVLFVITSVLISGWKGVRGLLGMAISLGVILWYIIPNILAGQNPLAVSITGAFFLLSVTLYLVYGWNMKTHSAVLGTLIALSLTGIFAALFTNFARLTGFGNEDALFLVQQTSMTFDLRGLVLGGMLIGALGVLDDLVITQASVVFTLHETDPSMPFWVLFGRGMRVGQDHVAATINTLVLAYAGAALPTLLLFSLSGEQFSTIINFEFVAEEIVRTLVGSMGLITAVPITTALACLTALYHERLGRLTKYLGPVSGEGGHTH